MRRTIFMALVAALLLVPSAAHADPTEIIRDCADDDVLQGNYSPSELREAREKLPTDIDEYSSCRDVLSRALADKSASSGGNGGGSNGTGGGSNPSPNPDPGSPAPDSSAAPTATPRPPIPPGPPTEQDTAALAEALNNGPRAVDVDGRPVSPGEARLAASIGRNTVPGSLFAVFGLLVVTGVVALGAPFIRRRVIARKQT